MKKQLTIKDEAMTAVTVGLTILGKPMTKIAEMLSIHRDTVRAYLEGETGKDLIEPFKNLIVMAHGRATEVVLQDLSYEGENIQLRQIRNKTALQVLKATGVLPKESRGDVYLLQQNNYLDAVARQYLQDMLEFKGLIELKNREVIDIDNVDSK